MTGSRTNTMDHETVLAAVGDLAENQDYQWDGTDEDDRPATQEELQAGIETYRKKIGRPVSDNPKVFTSIRLDADIVERFKQDGKGWQTRVNAALREWMEAHPA